MKHCCCDLYQSQPFSYLGGTRAKARHPCRLNYRLSMACHDTIMNKCADSCTSTSIDQPCGGTVLRCLTEKLDEITDAECKKEVFYFIKMEVRAFHDYFRSCE